jgi:anti-sigma factor RsiW
MMNCQNVKCLLSEFADERLNAATAWQVQTHLSECAACGQISRDLNAVRRLVQTLPAQGPSARFDDVLAQRLALTRRPAAPPQTWHTKTARLLVPQYPSVRRLRPALACGLVAAAGTFAAFFPIHSVPPAAPAAVRSADHAFVADCVAQHHQDAATEPLADLSAQTLAGRLESSAPTDTSADSSLF